MTEIADLLSRRARSTAEAFMAAYDRQRAAMRIAGRPSSELAPGDDGETVVADVAACMTVTTSLSPVGLTASVLDRMRAREEPAFAVLDRAAQAYFASEALRQAMGRAAVERFHLLREALSAHAPAGPGGA